VLVDTPQFEPWLTAWEVVDLARHLTAPDLPPERVDEVLVEVGLADVMHRRNGGFSRGMLQRLGLAGALVGDPEILLLDEPSSALDPAGRREVLDLVGRLAHTKTVILSTHILADVQQVADVVGVIDHGLMQFQGPLTDLLARTSTAYLLQVRPPAEGLLEELRGLAWVEAVHELAPGRVRIVVSDAVTAEQELPRLITELKLCLVAFNPATDLESAFLELTS
jgi:ABC-2 type transport system ATP-binding protein